MKPVGELTLTLAGCVSTLERYKRNKLYREFFVERKRFHKLRREYLAIRWEEVQCYLGIKEAYKVIA